MACPVSAPLPQPIPQQTVEVVDVALYRVSVFEVWESNAVVCRRVTRAGAWTVLVGRDGDGRADLVPRERSPISLRPVPRFPGPAGTRTLRTQASPDGASTSAWSGTLPDRGRRVGCTQPRTGSRA